MNKYEKCTICNKRISNSEKGSWYCTGHSRYEIARKLAQFAQIGLFSLLVLSAFAHHAEARGLSVHMHHYTRGIYHVRLIKTSFHFRVHKYKLPSGIKVVRAKSIRFKYIKP